MNTALSILSGRVAQARVSTEASGFSGKIDPESNEFKGLDGLRIGGLLFKRAEPKGYDWLYVFPNGCSLGIYYDHDRDNENAFLNARTHFVKNLKVTNDTTDFEQIFDAIQIIDSEPDDDGNYEYISIDTTKLDDPVRKAAKQIKYLDDLIGSLPRSFDLYDHVFERLPVNKKQGMFVFSYANRDRTVMINSNISAGRKTLALVCRVDLLSAMTNNGRIATDSYESNLTVESITFDKIKEDLSKSFKKMDLAKKSSSSSFSFNFGAKKPTTKIIKDAALFAKDLNAILKKHQLDVAAPKKAKKHA